MKSTALLLVIFTICSILVKGQNAPNGTSNLRCYVCEAETTNACQINPDVTTLTSIQCSEMQYPTPREGETPNNITNDVLSRAIDGKFRGTPLVGEIFQSSRTGEKSENYVCLTLELTSGDKKGITRLCERHPRHVENICDFVKQEIPPSFKVDSCKACYTDNCNSSPSIYMSFTLLLVISICHAFRKL